MLQKWLALQDMPSGVSDVDNMGITNDLNIILCEWVFYLLLCEHVFSAQKRVLDPSELKLHKDFSWHVGAGTWPRVCWKSNVCF